MHIEPKVLSQLTNKQKIELFDWLVSKMVVTDPDYWEQDAFMEFPKFYFGFGSSESLNDAATVMMRARESDRQFPTTYKEQQERLQKSKEIENEMAKGSQRTTK